jgi:hypothetical protein
VKVAEPGCEGPSQEDSAPAGNAVTYQYGRLRLRFRDAGFFDC